MSEPAPPRNFVILFEEKEGTSAFVRMLANLDEVAVVHQAGNRGWEPFDPHNCGPMTPRRMLQCLDLVYGQRPPDMGRLNAVYLRTGKRPLETIGARPVVGFKMRLRPPAVRAPRFAGWPILGRIERRLLSPRRAAARYRAALFARFRKHGVVVFLAVRQDVLRWALSKYHGDGTGRAGHLQFKLAAGEIRREDIPGIHVDCERLEALIAGCEASHTAKRALLQELHAAGVATHLVCYEDFLVDPAGSVQDFLRRLGVSLPEAAVRQAVAKGAGLEKVHGHDISTFVTNHEEVLARFGDRFVTWPEARNPVNP